MARLLAPLVARISSATSGGGVSVGMVPGIAALAMTWISFRALATPCVPPRYRVSSIALFAAERGSACVLEPIS